jgi:hypothetical protein
VSERKILEFCRLFFLNRKGFAGAINMGAPRLGILPKRRRGMRKEGKNRTGSVRDEDWAMCEHKIRKWGMKERK